MPTVQLVPQFSVFLVNKPGVLAQVTKSLADAKVNIVAMTLVDSQEHGVLRIVAGNPDNAHRALQNLGLPLTQTDVLCVEMSNRPGALADVAQLLGTNHVNINYAYVSAGAPGGRTTGVFKVADHNKAMKLLETKAARSSKSREKVNRKPQPRR